MGRARRRLGAVRARPRGRGALRRAPGRMRALHGDRAGVALHRRGPRVRAAGRGTAAGAEVPADGGRRGRAAHPGGPGAPVEVGEVPEPQWPLGEPHPGTPGTAPTGSPGRPAPPSRREPSQPPTSPGDPRSDVPANGRPAAPGDRPDRPGPADREAAPGPPDTTDLAAGEAASGRPGRPDRAAGEAASGGRISRPATPRTGGRTGLTVRPARPRSDGRTSRTRRPGPASAAATSRTSRPLSGRHSAAEESAVPGSDAQTVVPLEPRRWGRVIAAGVAAAAAIALIAGLLVSNVRLRDDQSTCARSWPQRDAAIKQLTANGPARVAALTANGQPSPSRKRHARRPRRPDRDHRRRRSAPRARNQRYWLWTLRCDTPQPTDLKPIRGFSVSSVRLQRARHRIRPGSRFRTVLRDQLARSVRRHRRPRGRSWRWGSPS